LVVGTKLSRVLLLAAVGLFLGGCHTDMWVQPHLRAQQESDFENFPDRSASRPVMIGTVARGQARDDVGYFTGRLAGQYVTQIPADQAIAALKLKSYRDLILRGQERFTIYCTPCHGQLGDGKGMIAQRGLALRRPPATYHTDRLRKMPVGHFFDVMTNGYGVMYSYASRVEVPDRWAIIAYIRTLQMSQAAQFSQVPTQDRSNIKPEPPLAEKAR
jgi:mono/diheme cytochrome c family protein